MLIFGLLGLLYVDVADLGEGAKQLVRWCLWLPPVLIPAGFGLSVASPRATRPNGLIVLVYGGEAVLALAAIVLGVGLLR